MPKWYSSAHIIRILEKHGFTYKSQKGSHVKYRKESHTVIISHPRKLPGQGTFFSIVRQAGLTKEDFE